MAAKPSLIKGDTVMIRRGKEKGKRGVIKTIFADHDQATVEGLNIVKRHTKAGQQRGNMGAQQSGGIVEKEAPLPLSVLQYVCEKCKTPTRLRRGRASDGLVHRVCVKCGEPARESAKGA
ncbi:MAG TPA: 50S ribosomal protein L24 [Candidatus Acidoferrum sp.]|jgi:large subunit ribosomal protein L24|nr:50S ribosomal protein L24 [Candidatus Acidoferrum sp.]